jgi:hypothetical protein
MLLAALVLVTAAYLVMRNRVQVLEQEKAAMGMGIQGPRIVLPRADSYGF